LIGSQNLGNRQPERANSVSSGTKKSPKNSNKNISKHQRSSSKYHGLLSAVSNRPSSQTHSKFSLSKLDTPDFGSCLFPSQVRPQAIEGLEEIDRRSHREIKTDSMESTPSPSAVTPLQFIHLGKLPNEEQCKELVNKYINLWNELV